MGNEQSSPPPPPAIMVQSDPKPVIDPLDGLSISASQGCKECRLAVPQGSSSSTAKIRRIGGNDTPATTIEILPSIPFKVSFNGTSYTLSKMLLAYPSPIKIENVQHDASLWLSSENGLSIIIPLVGSNNPSQAGTFISKIASSIPSTATQDPTTKKYATIDVATGSDWNLSMLFPAKPSHLENIVDVPFFTWLLAPPMVQYQISIENNIQRMGWKPAENFPSVRFIMLKNPIEIDNDSLAFIRTLPPTPVPELNILQGSLLYKPSTVCNSNGTNYTGTCDPFANIPQQERINVDTLWQTLVGLISTIAILIGLILGIKYAADTVWGIGIKNWVISFFTKKNPKSPFTATSTIPEELSDQLPENLTPVNPLFNPENVRRRRRTPRSGLVTKEQAIQAHRRIKEREARQRAAAGTGV